uniref:Uncharacterized protein n=1 Tax=Rhizophora mucronata TaxID=61149 RepID=A0A2P2L0X1_RHIMU
MKTKREEDQVYSEEGVLKRQRVLEDSVQAIENPLVPYNDVDEEDEDERREQIRSVREDKRDSGGGKNGYPMGEVNENGDNDDGDYDDMYGMESNQEMRRSQIAPREDCPYLDTVNRQVWIWIEYVGFGLGIVM